MASTGSHQSASYGDGLRASVRQEGLAWYRRYMLSFAAAMFVLELLMPVTRYTAWGWALIWSLWVLGVVAIGWQEFRQRVRPPGCLKTITVLLTTLAVLIVMIAISTAFIGNDAAAWAWAAVTAFAVAATPVYAAITAGRR